MAIHLIGRATARRMPWKNGAGLPLEPAMAPRTADPRVSRLAEPGTDNSESF